MYAISSSNVYLLVVVKTLCLYCKVNVRQANKQTNTRNYIKKVLDLAFVLKYDNRNQLEIKQTKEKNGNEICERLA